MFAERLKELRKQRGLTQERLAKIIGVERSTIGKYEGKGGVIPSDDIKYKLAELFGVSVDYLLGRTDIPIQIDYSSLSKEEKDVVLMYRELSDNAQELVIDYLRMLLSKKGYRKESCVPLAK